MKLEDFSSILKKLSPGRHELAVTSVTYGTNEYGPWINISGKVGDKDFSFFRKPAGKTLFLVANDLIALGYDSQEDLGTSVEDIGEAYREYMNGKTIRLSAADKRDATGTIRNNISVLGYSEAPVGV